jgi:hypothetical protein
MSPPFALRGRECVGQVVAVFSESSVLIRARCDRFSATTCPVREQRTGVYTSFDVRTILGHWWVGSSAIWMNNKDRKGLTAVRDTPSVAVSFLCC